MIVLRVVNVPPLNAATPPSFLAELLPIVQLSVVIAPPAFQMPPALPNVVVELPEIVTLVRFSTLPVLVKNAPPLLAMLPKSAQLFSVNVPPLSSSTALPLAAVKFKLLAVRLAPPPSRKIWVVLFPLSVIVFGPV